MKLLNPSEAMLSKFDQHFMFPENARVAKDVLLSMH